MSETTTKIGICACCVHVSGCVLEEPYAASRLAPTRCAEFEFSLPADKPAVPIRNNPAAESPATPAKTLAGICATCLDGDTCTYPKPDGGIWNCGDYR